MSFPGPAGTRPGVLVWRVRLRPPPHPVLLASVSPGLACWRGPQNAALRGRRRAGRAGEARGSARPADVWERSLSKVRFWHLLSVHCTAAEALPCVLAGRSEWRATAAGSRPHLRAELPLDARVRLHSSSRDRDRRWPLAPLSDSERKTGGSATPALPSPPVSAPAAPEAGVRPRAAWRCPPVLCCP